MSLYISIYCLLGAHVVRRFDYNLTSLLSSKSNHLLQGDGVTQILQKLIMHIKEPKILTHCTGLKTHLFFNKVVRSLLIGSLSTTYLSNNIKNSQNRIFGLQVYQYK